MITYGKYPGRFGNQLFCIAGTVGIARRNEMDFGFEAQTSFQSIFEKTLPAASKTTIQEYTQEHFHYYPITLPEPTRLIGYFQSEKFFSNAADEVRELFKIKKSKIDEVLAEYPDIRKSCVLHVRRTDYLEQPNHHPTLPLEYYKYFLSTYGDRYDKVYICSDDNKWAEDNFDQELTTVIKFKSDHDSNSFILLTLAKGVVIANSSFSWWGAWLNPNAEIYAPPHTKWFGPAYAHYKTLDIIPSHWNILKYNED